MAEILPSGAQFLAPGQAMAPYASGRYYFVPSISAASTSAALGVGTLRAMPFYNPFGVTISRIGAEITSGGDVGSKLRLGIYADDGTGRPGALVLDAGTIAGDSATVQEIVVSQALPTGILWAAAAVQVVTVTQPTVRTQTPGGYAPIDMGTVIPTAGAFAYGFTGAAAGALPTPFVVTGQAGAVPRLFIKVA